MGIAVQVHKHCKPCSVEWMQWRDDPVEPCWLCGAEPTHGEYRDGADQPLRMSGSATWNVAVNGRETA